MKILQLLNQPQLRGAEMFASQLSRQLIDKGHTSDLLALYTGPLTHFPNGLEVKTLGSNVSSRMLDYGGWKKLARIINDGKYDVVQSNAGNTLKFAVFSKLLFRWKAPIVFRNANKMGDFIDTPTKKLFNQFLVSKISQVVSVSNSCEDDFKATFNYSKEQIETIPIGIDFPDIPDSPPSDLRHLFLNGRVFVNVGSFVKEKNHKGLLTIFSRLKTAYPEAKLLIIGKGPLQAELEKQVAELNIKDDVHFLGSRTDVLSIVKHSTAFLMPSLIEGLPGVILEAFYCKTPVISNDVGGISQVVQPDNTGWLVKKGDEDVFVHSVKEAVDNEENTGRIIDNAYRLVTTEYRNAVIADRFLNAYQRAIRL